MAQTGQFRNVSICFNNPRPADRHRFTALLGGEVAGVRFFVMQEERGNGTDGVPAGTLHFQAYIQFTRRVRWGTLLRVLDPDHRGCHFERARGTCQDNITYCTKEGTRVEGGLRGQSGTPRHRGAPVKGINRQFETAVLAIVAQEELEEVEEANPVAFAMFPDKLFDFYLSRQGVRDWAMDIEIYVGPTGTGKSTTAKLENPGAYWGSWPMGGRWWWPRYKGQECVVLDDFFEQIRLRKMMELLDRHHFGLEAKGRNMEFVSRKLIITTNKDPCEWYEFKEKFREGRMTNERRKILLAPLERRIGAANCKIFDFALGHEYPGFVKVRRTVLFVFKDVVVRDGGGYGAIRNGREAIADGFQREAGSFD